MSALAQRLRAGTGSGSSPITIVAVFAGATLAGVGLSAAVAGGQPILAARWSLLGQLALWASVWIVATAAALRLPRRSAVALIMSAALALRLAALAGQPTTSDDLFRYAWDGRVQLSGIDPYAHPPFAAQLSGLREPWLWPDDAGCAALRRPPGCTRLNRPAVRTIYPPVAEAWFAAIYRVGGIGHHHKPWQIAGLVTDMATVGLLLIALRRSGRDRRWVALYALSPVPVLEIVNNGHVDGLAIALMAAALAVAVGPGTGTATARQSRRDVMVGLLIGMAALVKLYPALLIPAVAGMADTAGAVIAGTRRPWSWPWRSVARAAAAAVAVMVIAYLPHVAAVGWRVVGYLPGYLKEEHYNQGGRFLLAGIFGLPGAIATALAASAVLGSVGWVLWRRPPFPNAAALLLGVLFLTTTPVQPWYATSLIAVASLTTWPWWAAVTAAGYPYFFAIILDYRHPVGLGQASFSAALVVLIAAASLGRVRRPARLMAISGSNLGKK